MVVQHGALDRGRATDWALGRARGDVALARLDLLWEHAVSPEQADVFRLAVASLQQGAQLHWLVDPHGGRPAEWHVPFDPQAKLEKAGKAGAEALALGGDHLHKDDTALFRSDLDA